MVTSMGKSIEKFVGSESKGPLEVNAMPLSLTGQGGI